MLYPLTIACLWCYYFKFVIVFFIRNLIPQSINSLLFNLIVFKNYLKCIRAYFSFNEIQCKKRTKYTAKIKLLITYDKSKMKTVIAPDLVTCRHQSICRFVVVTAVHLLINITHTDSQHLVFVFICVTVETSNTILLSWSILCLLINYYTWNNIGVLKTLYFRQEIFVVSTF